MSVRDEMARALHARDWPHTWFDAESEGEMRAIYVSRADALMPIVERVAREAAIKGINEGAL